MQSRRTTPFSLVELTVVSAIVMVAVALTLPAVTKASNRAQQTACHSTLKQWHLALSFYAEDHQGWYPGFYAVSGITHTLRTGEVNPFTRNWQLQDALWLDYTAGPADADTYVCEAGRGRMYWRYADAASGYNPFAYFGDLEAVWNQGFTGYELCLANDNIDLRDNAGPSGIVGRQPRDSDRPATWLALDSGTAYATNNMAPWGLPMRANHAAGPASAALNILHLDGHISQRDFVGDIGSVPRYHGYDAD